MANYKKWKDVRRFGSDEEETINRSWVNDQLLEMSLKEIREFSGLTQHEAASVGEFGQSEISKIESREDHKLSTLRRYIHSLGGELEISARFGDHSIRVKGI